MRGGKERREEVEDTEEKGGSGEEMEQSRERERVMFQNKGSTLNATPWPRPAWKGCDFCIKRPLGRTRPRGQAESLPQPLAGRAGSRLAAFIAGPAPRAGPLPGAREPRPTFFHAGQLGLIHAHVGHGGRWASGARTPRRTPTSRAGRVDAELPRAGNAPGVQYGGREETERRRWRGAGAARLHRTPKRASQTASPRSGACRAQPRPQLGVREARTEGCTCQLGARIGPV